MDRGPGIFRHKSYGNAVPYTFEGLPIELFRVMFVFVSKFLKFDVIDVMP